MSKSVVWNGMNEERHSCKSVGWHGVAWLVGTNEESDGVLYISCTYEAKGYSRMIHLKNLRKCLQTTEHRLSEKKSCMKACPEKCKLS